MIQTKRETLQKKFNISVLLNILLVLAMIAMFIITLTSDNPNMLNYERTLQNRYATWEQELVEWESELREWEREQNRE